MLLALGLLAGCSGDDAAVPTTTTAPPVVSPTTTAPADCDAFGDRYLEAFFAVGAGTPSDATATTVVLPLGELRSIQAEASAAGCSGFRVVICSAWAQLEADGLTAQIRAPHCPG